jgi:hypothetical protein
LRVAITLSMCCGGDVRLLILGAFANTHIGQSNSLEM